jgi:hypothetical protein
MLDCECGGSQIGGDASARPSHQAKGGMHQPVQAIRLSLDSPKWIYEACIWGCSILFNDFDFFRQRKYINIAKYPLHSIPAATKCSKDITDTCIPTTKEEEEK